MQNLMRKLRSSREQFDASSASRRVDFFAKNLELLKRGKPPTSGFRHQLEARLQWLIDLKFVDPEHLCRRERIRLSSFVKSSFHLENGMLARGRNEILPAYATYLRDIPPQEPVEALRHSDTESLVERSISLLRNNYGKLVPAEAVIYITRILAFVVSNRRLERNEILETISKRHRLYRDWRGSGAFVE